MFDLMSPYLELPSALLDTIKTDLFKLEYKVTSTKEDKFSVYGTTLTGHPTLTTLFNTIRSILYQDYAFARAGMRAFVFAAGDDVLACMESPNLDLAKY